MICCARVHRQLRLVLLLDEHGERRLVGRGARLDVLLELREPLPRFLEREDVFLRVDGADQIVGRGVELAAPHVVARGEERDGVLGGLHGAVGAAS